MFVKGKAGAVPSAVSIHFLCQNLAVVVVFPSAKGWLAALRTNQSRP